MIEVHQRETLINLIIEYGLEKIAEIGVWKSHTTRVIVRHSEAYNKLKEYWAVDMWKVLSREHGRKMARRTQDVWDSMYKYCCGLMVFYPKLRVMRLSSVEACSLFPDEYFCLVFIDASHLYEDVLEDINIWWSKVRRGGILAGHDYEGYIGVNKAVKEVFGEVILAEADVWYKWKV